MAEKNIRVEIIGYDCGWGCKDFGCEDGPSMVAADTILLKLRQQDIEAKWRGALGLKFLGSHQELNTKEKTLPLVIESVRRLSNYVRHAVEQGHIPVVIGGDHSSAIGTWSGVTAGLGAHSRFGLIWIDAHLDSHTKETSHQGKFGGWWHGQPVTALTGYGLPELKNVSSHIPKISPKHLSIIGVHSFEPAELEFIKKHNIRIYCLDEVIARGFKTVYEEALARATEGTEGFGITIDLDAFQPSDAPGVSALEDKGMAAASVLPIIKSVAYHPLFRALEIAEFNPHRDIGNKTRNLIEKIVESIFTK